MGNQREVRQLRPSAHLGVAIPIRNGCAGTISDILAQHDQGHFYTYLAAPHEDCLIQNMDSCETVIGRSHTHRLVIQSGGKMWCGYDAFCNHIACLAKCLENALFFVGDEEYYIDQFLIEAGSLILTRVHSGCWRPVDEYIREQFPEYEA